MSDEPDMVRLPSGVRLMAASRGADDRGSGLALVRPDYAPGVDFRAAQTTLVTSRRGVVRGPHIATGEGCAKLVVCVSGTIHDVLVDCRADSPTFGAVAGIDLDGDEPAAVYLPPGIGHGFAALSPTATVAISVDRPGAGEIGINAFDPDLGIVWPEGIDQANAIRSERDAAAPTFAEAMRRGTEQSES